MLSTDAMDGGCLIKKGGKIEGFGFDGSALIVGFFFLFFDVSYFFKKRNPKICYEQFDECLCTFSMYSLGNFYITGLHITLIPHATQELCYVTM